MDLRESRFCHAGYDMGFSVFADHLCRVRYLESVPLPIGHAMVDVYAIEPGPQCQWVVVEQKEEGQSHLRFFLRQEEAFPERTPGQIPTDLKKNIDERLGKRPRIEQRPHAA